jgi:hypothetical protein
MTPPRRSEKSAEAIVVPEKPEELRKVHRDEGLNLGITE